jgi:hypothetical protein
VLAELFQQFSALSFCSLERGKEEKKRTSSPVGGPGIAAGLQQLGFHGCYVLKKANLKVVIFHYAPICIGSLLLGEITMLSNLCNHESEIFF